VECLDTRAFRISAASVHALTATAGCVRLARHTAARMNVLGGGGSLAGSAKAESSRFPDGRGHGARGRTQNAYRYYPAFSTGPEIREAEHGSETRKRRAGRVATKLHRAGSAPRSATAEMPSAEYVSGVLREARFRLAGSRLDGRTHALPMCLVDRMESLKARKAGPTLRGYGAAAQ
jgi:hypothetical protein